MGFRNFFFLMLLFPLLLFSQEDVNRFDGNGKRHGVWEKRYDSGRIRYRGKFFHGKEVGDFYFYENKIINNYPTIKKFFIKGTDIADVIFYNIDGKLKSDGQMRGKKRIGVWRYYNDKGDIIIKEEYDNDGILNGKTTVYFVNGKKAEEKSYKNGVLHGVATRYSDKGIKLHEMAYEDGLLHGRTTFYEANGDIKESGLYYKDYKVGKWDFYLDGEFMGYKEPNKKRDHPDDEHIMANIEGKKEKKREYAKLSDDEILKNISSKMDVKIKKVEKATDELILKSIKSKKKGTKKIEKLTDEEILENIKKKNSLSPEEIKRIELRMKAKKLYDQQVLEKVKKKKK
ncbi:toxin-antitoxin system YwqK family antitoxin [Wenyingzhuangia sp. IMCC45533]